MQVVFLLSGIGFTGQCSNKMLQIITPHPRIISEMIEPKFMEYINK